jgi:hypothetical protein
LWDKNFLQSLGITDGHPEFKQSKKYIPLGIWAGAWLNPDGTTTIGHSFVNINSDIFIDNTRNYMPMPSVDAYNFKEFIPIQRIQSSREIIKVWEKYPELKPPLDLTKQWVKTRIMPKELENILFKMSGTQSQWY